MRTDQDKIILWDKLDGVKEFEHDDHYSNTNPDYLCRKCGHKRVSMAGKDASEFLCPIPDKYPHSEADIAEKIRQWMEKQNFTTRQSYHWKLMDIQKNTKHFQTSMDYWMIMFCTPADKIQAFITMFKEQTP